MKRLILALVAVGALSLSAALPDTAEARPRGYYGRGGVSVNVGRGYRGYNYRPYYNYGYRNYGYRPYYNYGYRPYYYRSYRPYNYGYPCYGRSYFGGRSGIYIGF